MEGHVVAILGAEDLSSVVAVSPYKSSEGITASLFAHLRVIPSTHSQRLPPRPPIPQSDLAYDALESNPYLPFWTVWKPATPWSKAKWDRGSEAGLDRQRPDYMVAVVE